MMFGLVTRARFDAVVANAERSQEIAERTIAELRKLRLDNRDLRARLRVFTAPRDRNPNGTFKKAARS